MPNLWTSTTQKIYEAFYGPRTKDSEFDTKVEELKACERNLQGVKLMFTNFPRNTQGLKAACKDVYTTINLAYSEDSPYFPTIVEIAQVHQEVERLYSNMADVVGMISAQTQEWDRNFLDAKKHISIRDEFRRSYDHYDEKLEKLVKARNLKGSKNQSETPQEIEAFDRNDEKYKKATDEYVKQSLYTYNLICELLEFRYKLINPAITNFVNEERKFYTAVSELFKRYENLQNKFQNFERLPKNNPSVKYDPRKYVRGYALLNGVNVNDLPALKENEDAKQKYSYEDYIKNKQSNSNLNNSSSQILDSQKQEVKPEVKQFSYDHYLQNKNSKLPNNNQINSNISSSNQFNDFNNNYSREFKQPVEVSKPDQLRNTTIVGQFNMNENEQQPAESDQNPYSLFTFDNKPQMTFSNIGAQSNYNKNVSSINNSMYNLGIGNNSNQTNNQRSQINNNPYGQYGMPQSNNNQNNLYNPNNYSFINNQNNMPQGNSNSNSSQMKFPR